MELYVLVEQYIMDTFFNLPGTSLNNVILKNNIIPMLRIFTYNSTCLRKCLNLTKIGTVCLSGYETFL